MTINDLKESKYRAELSERDKHAELKYKMFAPFFENLCDSKVIYYEHFAAVIKLKDIKITEERFEAVAEPVIRIPREPDYPMPSTWKISCQWKSLHISDNYLATSPYSFWCIWFDHETVRKTEELALKQEYKKALNLFLPDLFWGMEVQ